MAKSAKIRPFEIIGETTKGFWTHEQYAKPTRNLLKSGKKLSRQQFVRRTLPGARGYAEKCARTRIDGFAIKDAKYVEGVIEGRQVVLMAAGGLIWMFRDHKDIPTWGTPVAQVQSAVA